jgi:hypothetical protein
MLKYLWRWWLDGTPPPNFGPEWAQLKDSPSGGFWSGEDFSHYYYSQWNRNVMAALKDYLHSGYGVAVMIYDSANSLIPGHALTVWGYRYYPDGTVIGLWVTDSDDGASEPPELRLLPVTYEANWIGPDLYELKWRVASDSYAYQEWLIEGVQALKPRNSHLLRIRKAGSGTGSVASIPDGILCGDQCVKPYSEGTVVSITATPEAGSVFIGWAGACSGQADCVVTIDDAIEVVAIFDLLPGASPETFTLEITAESGVTIHSGDVDDVPDGSDVTVTLEPDDDYIILDVIVDGHSVGPVSELTIPDISADHQIQVRTIQKNARLAIVWKKCFDESGTEKACTPGSNATVIVGDQSCDSECMRITVPFVDGEALILQVKPDRGHEFLQWETTDENGQPLVIDMDNYDERVLYRLEDILLRPGIGECSHC